MRLVSPPLRDGLDDSSARGDAIRQRSTCACAQVPPHRPDRHVRRCRAGRRPGYWGTGSGTNPGAEARRRTAVPSSVFEGLRLAASTRPGSLGDRGLPSQPGLSWVPWRCPGKAQARRRCSTTGLRRLAKPPSPQRSRKPGDGLTRDHSQALTILPPCWRLWCEVVNSQRELARRRHRDGPRGAERSWEGESDHRTVRLGRSWASPTEPTPGLRRPAVRGRCALWFQSGLLCG